MSRLDELIQELCPNGVEYKPIKNVYRRLKGTPITAGKMKEIESADGDIRIFAGGKTIIDAFESDIPNANITRVPAVLVQSRGVIDAVYYEKPFTFKNEMWAYTHKNKIAVKFLYYVLKNNMSKFREAASGMGSLPQISLKITEDFEIPVPPLEVQSEIVRILDNFTELRAELRAELTARKKQYEYYRDKLLSFNELRKSGGCQLKKLREIAEYSHKRINAIAMKKDNYVGVDNLLPNKAGKVGSNYVPTKGNLTAYVIGDVLIGNIRPYLKKIWLAYNEGGASGDVLVIHLTDQSVDVKYLYQVLADDKFFNYNMQFAKGAKMPRGSKQKIMDYIIPVPSLEEQRRIVSILDKLDTLTTSISEGLPKEIELRRKQYEYYRNQLLSFPDNKATA